MRLIIGFICVCLLAGCSSWRKRNIAIYERSLDAVDQKSLPPEPTLAKKRVDDVSEDSILNRDGLNPAERAILEREKVKDEAKRKKRREKIFNVFSPNYGK